VKVDGRSFFGPQIISIVTALSYLLKGNVCIHFLNMVVLSQDKLSSWPNHYYYYYYLLKLIILTYLT